MSTSDNRDLRNIGKGGWSFVEHELWSVFAPLIGADGVVVYAAMCRLIPLAAVDPRKPVTLRSVADASTVSKSTVGRKIAEIVRMGMLTEKRSSAKRPATYDIHPLRELAEVGTAELRRRLGLDVMSRGVPQGDTAELFAVPDAEPTGISLAARSGVGGVIPHMAAVADVEYAAEPAGGCCGDGVPPWDTDEPETMRIGLRGSVSQNLALVSHVEASVSQKTGSVSQGAICLKEEEEERREEITPLPPVPGGVVSTAVLGGPVLPDPATQPGGTNWALNVGIAARWVLGEMGVVANTRMLGIVSRALEAWMQAAPRRMLAAGAELMTSSHAHYHAAMEAGKLRFGPWKPVNFIRDGHWRREASWPWKEMPARLRDVGVGMDAARAGSDERAAAELKRQRAFLESNAERIGALRGFEWAAEVVRTALLNLDAGVPLETLDRVLEDLEDEMYEQQRAALAADELAELEAAAKAKVQTFPGKTTHAVILELREQVVRKMVRDKHRLPRLSFFYMPASG